MNVDVVITLLPARSATARTTAWLPSESAEEGVKTAEDAVTTDEEVTSTPSKLSRTEAASMPRPSSEYDAAMTGKAVVTTLASSGCSATLGALLSTSKTTSKPADRRPARPSDSRTTTRRSPSRDGSTLRRMGGPTSSRTPRSAPTRSAPASAKRSLLWSTA